MGFGFCLHLQGIFKLLWYPRNTETYLNWGIIYLTWCIFVTFWIVVSTCKTCKAGYNDSGVKNYRQILSEKRTEKNKDMKERQTAFSETHVYQYSSKVPVNQSDTALSDIHSCIQMSIHQSNSQFDRKIINRVAPIRGVERTRQIFDSVKWKSKYSSANNVYLTF